MKMRNNNKKNMKNMKKQNQQPLGEIPPQNLSIHRSTKPHRPSQRYPPSEYILLTDEGEPVCFQEACEGENSIKWKKAMQEELKSLHDNKTWDLVEWTKRKKGFKEQVGVSNKT
jgi:hypothetical protein